MEAQQIRLNINELVSGIQDEAFLNACYQAVEGIAKAYRRVLEKPNGVKKPPTVASRRDVPAVVTQEQADVIALTEAEKALPHDLSLVFLANEVFKGSQALPAAAVLAFDDALFESAIKEPTLPNRL